MISIDIPAFAASQLELLGHELQAELAETAEAAALSSPAALQRAGHALLNLHVDNQRTGLGGKTVLELQLDPAVGQSELPEHGFRVGDIVGVREQIGGSAKKKEKTESEKKGVDGVIVKTNITTVSVALDKEEPEVPGGKLWITKLANDVTYKRLNQTMTRLQKMSDAELSPFIRVLFGQSHPTPVSKDNNELNEELGTVDWITESLNDSQKDAIRFALASRDIALIHGPPGTGKTHTLIELILQLLQRGLRVLVAGPSNISVDNIVERLAPHKVPMVRLGHPARLLPSVVNHSLDILTKTSDAAALVQDVRTEMDQKQASIKKTRNGRERKVIYGDIRELRKEYRERERGCVDNLVRSSKVVLATLHGSGGNYLRNATFDVVIIDEASQALEAQCWVPLLSAKKAVLAGDHLQLPPTVKSLNSKAAKEAKSAEKSETAEASSEKSLKQSLERTLFDRLLVIHGPSIKRMLTIQYRMHELINRFPSDQLYESRLMAADSVKAHLLYQLPYEVMRTEDTSEPLVFYDTQGGEFPEKAEDSDLDSKPRRNLTLADSKSNEMEAAVVAMHVRKLIEAGVKPVDIAVVTPYNAQLSVLSPMLREQHPGIELGSVDGFQGREKEAVIVSLVRSNAEHEVGFLSEKRRLNVAMTRPRRHLCVVGDSETVGHGSTFLKAWMAFLEENADLRYPDPGDMLAGSG